MFNFDVENVSEVVSGGKGENKYIYGGIYEDIKITDVRSGTSLKKGTPFVEVEFQANAAQGDEGKKAFQFYFTGKKEVDETTVSKLKHIATKVIKEQTFNNALTVAKTVGTIESMASALRVLVGKKLRMQFNAEEYLNSNGEIKERATIGLPKFAEATQPGGEYPVVPKESSELKFDKTNQYQFKKLETPAMAESATPQVQGSSWLS